MAGKAKNKESLWITVFKLIFASILLLSVTSGTFLLGDKALGAKMQSERIVHTALGADLIKEDFSKK